MANTNYGLNLEVTKAKVGSNGDWYKVSALSSTGVTLSDTAISTAALIEQLEAATPETLYYVAGLMNIVSSAKNFYRDSTKDITIE